MEIPCWKVLECKFANFILWALCIRIRFTRCAEKVVEFDGIRKIFQNRFSTLWNDGVTYEILIGEADRVCERIVINCDNLPSVLSYPEYMLRVGCLNNFGFKIRFCKIIIHIFFC